ncbi:D-alanyl-D-alanine dipeptidase [Dyadobacter sp. BE34]|uniref:D-alanyl-D-alanine dipeptidase n=1 Tax=Dyadobacter fermentans TaxID=94254 RepID=A0ABU1R0P6_9BACT|nr:MULTISPECIES: M15 family metallopeptidase [Dyadobacter]MDR6806983.1 D-alanyl-D-alanine dipeptidase [Dyadobacter fermentans]MDR7044724.1 D-alanyl-D-alanine dipeptidase [Dyadobacter sp. BE242]MDR7199540.1 D-alanyl-D-alanine dipeptidase [Dyadobacter sp. BE34]MDR7217500.1 D-alanyl-D-alanine dipeptidase [Dyadobacter sp. BE31]MDR7265431.1 D-alanyl-D-alanine dipeptidase [Dyadobacter sp. BE32]
MLKTAFCLLLTGFAASHTFAQSSKSLPAIEQKMVDRGLVDIQKVDPEILVELKYSTTDNFIGRDVYGELTRAYLQPEMAKRLAKANALLKKEKPGYRLLVYDAARPNSAQYDLWNALDHLKIPARSKTQYVADPKIGSNHNFGCAIDLTVVDENGKPLDMGTKFDFFGPLAYPRSEQEMLKKGKLTARQIENRQLLRKVMTQVGFKVNTTEWWHFDGMSKAQARAKYGMIP